MSIFFLLRMETFLFFIALFNTENKKSEPTLFTLLQMANHFWDLKANYMLTFAVCKYGIKTDGWQLIAKDLSRHMVTTVEVNFIDTKTIITIIFIYSIK